MILKKCEAFYKAVELKSISKAANEMGYTQSAISKMIGELEKEWGLTLIRRNHDGVEVTSEGQAVLDDISKLLHDYDSLTSSVASLHGVNKGLIRLGAPNSIASNLLPNILKLFHEDYPNIKVELFEDEDAKISELLKKGVLDISVLPGNLSSKYDSIPFYKDKLVAILPRNHEKEGENVFDIKNFEKEDVIILKELVDYDMSRFFDDNKIKPQIAYEVTNDNIMLSMVEAGLGICTEYELLIKPLRYDVVVKKMSVTKERKLELCVKNRNEITPVVQLFIDSVKGYMTNEQSE